MKRRNVLVVVGLCVLSLLSIGCGKDQERAEVNLNTKKSASAPAEAPASAPQGFTRAEYKEHPVTVSFDFADANLNQVFSIQACDAAAKCDLYLKVDCSKGLCELIDGTTGNPRANYAFKSSRNNQQLRVDMSDLIFNTLGYPKLQIRAGEGAWKDMTLTNSLETVKTD